MASVSNTAAVIEACGAVVAAACALYVTLRDGRRIKSGEARALSERIDKAQEAAMGWHESVKGVALMVKVDSHEARISAHDAQLVGVATKVDVAALEGAIGAVAEKVGHAANGVDRIEGLLIKRALA